MAGPLFSKNRSRWVFSPEQRVFLAVLLLVLLLFHWVRGRSTLLPWLGSADQPRAAMGPFVVEIEGNLVSPGIYTFPARIGIREALQEAGVAGELIPRESRLPPLKTGTTLVLHHSSQGLTVQTVPMHPAKKVLYNIPIDLNTIQADDLTMIPGIGPTLAKRIVTYREHIGGFTHLDELLDVSGVGRRKLESLRPYLSVEHNVAAIP